MDKIKFSFYFKLVIASIPEITRPDFEALFLGLETFWNIAWIVLDILYQMQKTLVLYLHTYSRVFKTVKRLSPCFIYPF